MNVGIIGVGYWGLKILRSLSKIEKINIKYLCDVNLENIEKFKDEYLITSNYENILRDDEIEIVFIVTPINTHYKIICDCIKNKKNVFVEKPICKSITELEEIILTSKLNNVKFFCDYIFNYSDKIYTLKSLIGNIENIIYIEMNRNTERVFNSDNIIYDLLPHDLTILYKLFDKLDDKIKINFVDKICYNSDGLIIKTTIAFEIKNTKGTINMDFISNQKNRLIKIICKDKLMIYDDTTDIIEVYNYILDINESRVLNKFTNQEKIVAINYNEPLTTAIKSFLKIINENNNISYEEHIELNKKIVEKIQEINNNW